MNNYVSYLNQYRNPNAAYKKKYRVTKMFPNANLLAQQNEIT